MADNNIKIWAELTLDNKKIKTEFTKAGEEAWKSVAEWLDKQQWTIIDKINETIDEIRVKIESLNDIDWSLVDPTKTEQDIKFLDSELNTLQYTIENLKYGWQDFWDEWEEAFNNLQETAGEYENILYDTMDNLQYMWSGVWEAMDEAEEQTKETTEAVKELNETANQGISENGWLWKMLKFLSSKEIVNFFYKNLKKIWEKLIELSGDSEQLANKRQPVQDKLEQVWWYIGKWLVPAVETAIDEIGWMADELTKTGEDWSSALWLIQQWVFWIWQAFVAVIKVIKQFWQFLWDILSSRYVMITSFVDDLSETVSGFVQNIWSVEMWSAIWNNIKYWIVSWVNDAIGSLNNLLKWINNNLWIDLWEIWTFDAGQKMDLWFWGFWKTKQARADTKKYMSDSLADIGQERTDMRNQAMQGSKDLKNTSINDIKKVQDETKKRVWWWSKDSVKSEYKKLEDEAVDVWNELDDLVEDHQKQYDKLNEEIEKVEKKYDDLREEAKKTWEESEKALKSYNEELEKSQAEAITDLWQRYVELKKDLIGVDDYMKKIAENLSRKELQSYQDWWATKYQWYELKDLIELKEKLDELKLIEENTTEEQRKSEEFIKKTSKAQEILNNLNEKAAELEEKKAAAIEKQLIAEAMYSSKATENNFRIIAQNDEWRAWYKDVEGKRQEIHDADNIEYAKQLEEQATNLNEQLQEFKTEKDTEVEILVDTTARKVQLEEEYTKVFQENVKKQEKELDWLIQKEQRLIELRREYLSMWWWSSHNAYWWSVLEWHASVVGENGPETIIARQSSYVQPRNAWSSYNTINNDNSFSINWINVNVSNIDEFLSELKENLTYRN